MVLRPSFSLCRSVSSDRFVSIFISILVACKCVADDVANCEWKSLSKSGEQYNGNDWIRVDFSEEFIFSMVNDRQWDGVFQKLCATYTAVCARCGLLLRARFNHEIVSDMGMTRHIECWNYSILWRHWFAADECELYGCRRFQNSSLKKRWRLN